MKAEIQCQGLFERLRGLWIILICQLKFSKLKAKGCKPPFFGYTFLGPEWPFILYLWVNWIE